MEAAQRSTPGRKRENNTLRGRKDDASDSQMCSWWVKAIEHEAITIQGEGFAGDWDGENGRFSRVELRLPSGGYSAHEHRSGWRRCSRGVRTMDPGGSTKTRAILACGGLNGRTLLIQSAPLDLV